MTLQTYTTLGHPPINCAHYGVMIVDKVTRATVCRLPEVGWNLTYDYRIDRTSEATLTVDVGPGGVGDECCSRLGRAGHWMHELVIFREGSNREAWGGPITKLRDAPGRGQFTVQAKDRSAWWPRRAITRDLVYSGGSSTDAVRVFMDLLREAEQIGGTATWRLPYDPVRLNVQGRETGVIVNGKVLHAADIVMVGPEIQTLADSVIDWTVIGRTCYVGSLVLELDPLPILAQDHWLELDPEIEWDGETVATQVQVLGARGIRGEYPAGPIRHPRWPQYGSHTLRVSDPKITDQATATSRARTLWELHQQPALCVVSAGGSLGPNAPVIPQDLIPGRMTRVGFDTSCFVTSVRLGQTRANGVLQYVAYDSGIARDLVVAQRITKTTVTVEDSQETSVLVDLQPPGTDVLRRPGGRVSRQPDQPPEPPVEEGVCLVLEADDLAFDAGPSMGIIGIGDPGYCTDGGYLGMATSALEAVWSFSLTTEAADLFNSQGGFWLRAQIVVGTEGPATPADIDPGQVTIDVNGTPMDIGQMLLAEKVAATDPTPLWADSNVFIPIPAFVAGANVVTVTLVSRFNSDPIQTINVLRLDQFGLGADEDQVGDLSFAPTTNCLVCTGGGGDPDPPPEPEPLVFLGFSDQYARAASGTETVLLPRSSISPFTAPLWEAGDLLIAAIRVNDWGGGDSIAIPGWTQVIAETMANVHHSWDDRWEVWTKVAVGGDVDSTLTLVSTSGVLEGMSAAVHGYNADDPLPGFLAAVGDEDDPIQPRGARVSTLGLFVGFVASDNNDNVVTVADPDTYPCLHYTIPVFGMNGWCTDVLAGPSGAEDAPLTFVPGQPDRSASWLTLWVNADGATVTDPDPDTPPPGALFPEDFGAIGDGPTDDQAALEAVFLAVAPGQTVWLSAGQRYGHTGNLHFSVDNALLDGPGELHGLVQETSAVYVDGTDQIIGPCSAGSVNTSRGDSTDHMTWTISGTRPVFNGTKVLSSHCVGFFLYGATGAVLNNVEMLGSRADGIHNTFGTTGTRINGALIQDSGDDGLATVSYVGDPICSDIIATGVTIRRAGARGASVVGGTDVHYQIDEIDTTVAGGVYVSTESPPSSDTLDTSNVTIEVARIANANTGAEDHGDIFFFCGTGGKSVTGVTVTGVDGGGDGAIDSSDSASNFHVGGLCSDGSGLIDVDVADFLITPNDGKPVKFEGTNTTINLSNVGY